MTRRAARPLTADERDREADLLGRGQAVDERISRMLAARALTQDQEKALDDLRQQASEIRRQLLDLERQFEDKYGALASRPATLEEAQKALPEGTALVGWIDTKTDHWACLLRPCRRPGLGPARRLRQGRGLDEGGGRALPGPPRRTQSRDHRRQGRPAGRGRWRGSGSTRSRGTSRGSGG